MTPEEAVIEEANRIIRDEFVAYWNEITERARYIVEAFRKNGLIP